MEAHRFTPEVGKDSFAHTIYTFRTELTSLPPSPVSAYLSRLAPSSQHTLRKLLHHLVQFLGWSLPAEQFPWAQL